MKGALLFLALILTTQVKAVNLDSLYKDDVSSIEKICEAMIASYSGKASETKDWKRFENLFLSTAQQLDVSFEEEAEIVVSSLSDFMEHSKPWYDKSDFKEWALKYTIHQFGNIASVVQSWECEWNTPADKDTGSSRGLHGFQLVFNQGRWWIVNMIWDGETEDKIIDVKFTN